MKLLWAVKVGCDYVGIAYTIEKAFFRRKLLQETHKEKSCEHTRWKPPGNQKKKKERNFAVTY